MRNIKATLLYRWFEEVWNKNSEAAIDDMMNEDTIPHDLIPPGEPLGAAGFKTFYRGFRSNFKDVNVVVRHVVSEDDMESALTDVTAVHIPSGKEVRFSGICTVRIKDGRILEAWNHYDFLGMYQQLGFQLQEMK